LEIRESQYGMTAFLIACENGRVDVVKALAESGADINAKDNDGSDAKRLAETDKHDVCHSGVASDCGLPAKLYDTVSWFALFARVQDVLQLLQTLQQDDSGQSESGGTAQRKSTRSERAAKRKREPQIDEDGYL
jgi:hypothetical protein